MDTTLTLDKVTKYRVAIYIRLSKEDIQKDLKQDLSQSIINQRSLLEQYVKDQGYEIADVYIDDGFTGTNFNRPAFQRMISDLELGKANMVVTKDLSRLGRDYIETGEYIEKYFPKNKIRYVSLLDGIDTSLDSTNNDIAPFKAVLNDMYSKDNSKKIRTALKTKQLKGLWVGSCPPLGYMKDPEVKNHLIVNEDEAYIVRKIFDLAKNGYTYYEIREIFNNEKIPTASMLRKKHKNTPMANEGYWNTKTIRAMLSNELYLGDMVQNKRKRVSYKIRDIEKNPRSRWIIVPDTHEPLVDRETFKYVQKILMNCRVRSKKEIYRLLDGSLVCYDCKHKIMICKPRKSDGRTYTTCNTYRLYSKQKLCTPHSNNYDVLEETILKVLKETFKRCLEKSELSEVVADECKKSNPKNNYRIKLENTTNAINIKNEQLDKMYLEKLDGKITEDMYNRISKKIRFELTKLEFEKKDMEEILTNDEDEVKLSEECKKLIKEFLEVKSPDRKLMIKLIQRIEIHKDKELDIYFNFKKLNFLLQQNNH